MSTMNLRLELPRKLQNGYIGPFKVLKRVGLTAYKLALLDSAALKRKHSDFNVRLPRDFFDYWL